MVPAWCTTPTMERYWREPWTVPLSRLRGRRFKRRLWKHGLLSPNFTRAEAKSNDGAAIPRVLRGAAQRQAFHMERVRHACGNRSITVLSWYRSPSHNRSVGGATFSQHLFARACDVEHAVIETLGQGKWNRATEAIFANGGIGIDRATGDVRHVDSRRGPARWFY